MNCRNCGKEITDNVKFCPECGEKVLYELEVIEPIVSMEKGINEDQNQNILIVSDGFLAKLRKKYADMNIVIKIIIWIIIVISCLCFYTDHNQRQEKKAQERLQAGMDVKYSDGMEHLSKGNFVKAEKQFSAFNDDLRINSNGSDYIIGDKHYKDANILRLYAVAGKEFGKGADPTDTLDKIPNNYSGLFSQEIIALKKSVREMKEKIAAEKEAAEKEKKRKAEEERQRIVQEQERKKREEFLRRRASLPLQEKVLGHWVSNDWLADYLITPQGERIDKSCAVTPWHYYISEQVVFLTENEKMHNLAIQKWENISDEGVILTFGRKNFMLIEVSADGLNMKEVTTVQDGQYTRLLKRDLTYIDDKKHP